MKNLFFFFALLFFKNSYAQIDKGIWLVGGTGSFYSYTENYSTQTFSQVGKFTNIDIGASFGYFLIDKLALGLRPSFSSYKGEIVNTPGGTNQIMLSVGPFVRYYFLNKDNPFNILFDASYQPGINKYLRSPQEKGKFNTLSIMGEAKYFLIVLLGWNFCLAILRKCFQLKILKVQQKLLKRDFKHP